MQIEFLKVVVTEIPGQRGSYKRAEVYYKVDGKPRTIGVLSFNKAVFDVVTNASSGQILEAEFGKNDKGYWEMKSVNTTGEIAQPGQTVGSGTTTTAKASTGQWETREERAQRQVYIVRQSCLSTAVAFLQASGKIKFTAEDVKEAATVFEKFVFGT